MKSVKDMDEEELYAEARRVNKRIMLDKRQPWAIKRDAWRKMKDTKGYIENMRKLYE